MARSLGKSERYRTPILVVSVVMIVVALGSLKFIGTEFICRRSMKAPWLSPRNAYPALRSPNRSLSATKIEKNH